MPFTQLPCPSCKAVLRVVDSTPANTLIRCPKCGERFRTPAPAEDRDRAITSAGENMLPRTPGSPAIGTEAGPEVLRRIQRPAPRSLTGVWMLLGVLAAGAVLVVGGAGIGVAVWLRRMASQPPAPPLVQIVPPGANPPPARLAPRAGAPRPQGRTAEQWFSLGNLRRQQGDLDGAINAFTRAIEMNPRFAAAYCNRGLTRSDKRDFDGAIADATKSIELDPNDPFPFINRANARIQKGVDPEASIADASRALELRPGIPAALLNLGMARDQKGDYDGAIAEFDKALELLPTFVIAYGQRGQTRMKKKQWDKAEADFTHALKLNPARPDIYQQRGVSRGKQGNREGALADFTAALQLDPHNVSLFYQRGRLLFESGDLKGAQTNLDQALAIAPELLPLHTFRIKILLCEGDRDGALAAAERLVALQPKSADALACRAGVHAWRGEEEKALADYTAALTADPKSVVVHLLRGWLHFCAGREDEAAKDAEAGLKLGGRRHDHAPYLAILAHCARRRQHPNEARRDTAEAMSKKGENNWPEPVLRYLHADMSAEELSRAAADNDQRTESHAYVGVVLWLSGDDAKAREQLQWVRDNGNRDFIEYDLAVLLLHRLEKTAARKP
jgi:predicted Zn finger-like uncharacterized protein